MVAIKMVGKPGSSACKIIREKTGIKSYHITGREKTEVLINYGVAFDKLESFFKQYPSAKKLPMINKRCGRSKFSVVKEIDRIGILTPETKMKLSAIDKVDDWIEKRINSIGGIGIKKATHKNPINGKYYQKLITHRKYELRVHAFCWTKDWVIQKRIGNPDEIAWNFHNGGHFVTIHNPKSGRIFQEAVEISKKILFRLNISFGAVDFIVDNTGKLYFIEVNSAPGFRELSAPIYIEAFNQLKKMDKRDLLALQ